MSYRVDSLADTPFADVHGCFAQAFADYAVQSAVMSEAQLLRRARKNDWSPELSAGVWHRDRLVGISLTGLDRIDGELRAYDICTGIIAEHRGRGLAGMLMDTLRPPLKQAGAAAFQLEVLQTNLAGIRAYEKAGFAVTRGLVTYAGTIDVARPVRNAFEIQAIGASEIMDLSSQLEAPPSFEQRQSAIAHLENELTMLGAFVGGQCVGAVAYDSETAWFMRLVTHRRYRRRGVARALVAELARQSRPVGTLKAVNIDESDEATMALMSQCGMSESLRQWEMRRDLNELDGVRIAQGSHEQQRNRT